MNADDVARLKIALDDYERAPLGQLNRTAGLLMQAAKACGFDIDEHGDGCRLWSRAFVKARGL